MLLQDWQDAPTTIRLVKQAKQEQIELGTSILGCNGILGFWHWKFCCHIHRPYVVRDILIARYLTNGLPQYEDRIIYCKIHPKIGCAPLPSAQRHQNIWTHCHLETNNKSFRMSICCFQATRRVNQTAMKMLVAILVWKLKTISHHGMLRFRQAPISQTASPSRLDCSFFKPRNASIVPVGCQRFVEPSDETIWKKGKPTASSNSHFEKNIGALLLFHVFRFPASGQSFA